MEREEVEHFEEKIKVVDETGYSEKKASFLIEGGVGEVSDVGAQPLFDPHNQTKKPLKKIITVFDVHEES